MNFSLKVVGVQAQTIAKPERQPDGSVKNNTEQTIRIVARDETGNSLTFAVPYNEGKTIELDKVFAVTVE